MNVKGKLEWATFYYLCGLKWLRERGEPTGRGAGGNRQRRHNTNTTGAVNLDKRGRNHEKKNS
jgi:hypothetical protein